MAKKGLTVYYFDTTTKESTCQKVNLTKKLQKVTGKLTLFPRISIWPHVF